MSAASKYAQSFAEVFSLEPVGEDAFMARFPFAWGGASLACAAQAACLSAPDKTLRSLHAWFLRPVESETPIRVRVERIRDGRLLSHRRIAFETDGRQLFELTASLSASGGAEDAIAWQEPCLETSIPAPESLPSLFELGEAHGEVSKDPVEWRPIGTPHAYGVGGQASAWDAWVRPTMELPPGIGWDAAALAFLSDNHSDWSMAQRVRDYTIRRYSTLDSQIWFHRPPCWNDWALIRSASDVAHGGFGHGRRTLYNRDGALVATMMQEALYR